MVAFAALRPAPAYFTGHVAVGPSSSQRGPVFLSRHTVAKNPSSVLADYRIHQQTGGMKMERAHEPKPCRAVEPPSGETSADEKMLWFEATQTAEEVRHAALIEEAGADVLAGWLAEEPEEVIFNVDFGDFGRPVTAQGIEEWWKREADVWAKERGMDIMSHKSFQLKLEEEPVAHIEALIGKVDDISMSELNEFLGTDDPFVLLHGIFVPSGSRHLGLGHMIMTRTEKMLLASHPDVRHFVSLAPADSDVAITFFESMGYTEADVVVPFKGMDQKFKVFSRRIGKVDTDEAATKPED